MRRGGQWMVEKYLNDRLPTLPNVDANHAIERGVKRRNTVEKVQEIHVFATK
jgi:hypothetical protein